MYWPKCDISIPCKSVVIVKFQDLVKQSEPDVYICNIHPILLSSDHT
jgi:hypothetical protein